jgi:putative ABC transport system ATP-binding protein
VSRSPTELIAEAKQITRLADDGTRLINRVDFSIRSGDRLGIVGSSGSGKTVLLRALAALDSIQSGQLLHAGQAVSGAFVPEYRTRVVYLQQRPTLFEGTVETNLRKPFELAVHRNRAFNRDKVVGWLELLDRDAGFLDKDQQNLSGGELQIAALLRAIQLEPRALLLDEPTAALDAGATAAVERLVSQWTKQRPDTAFVWITHDAEQAKRMCQSIYQMTAGELAKDTSWNT